MTAQAPASPLLRLAFWLSKLLLVACVVGGPVLLGRIGRRVGGSGVNADRHAVR